MGGRLRSHGPVTRVRYEREWPGDLMHVAIDDRIRIRYPEKLGDEREGTCTAIVLRAAASYASLGVTVREAVTDDRPGCRSSAFAEATGSIGASHVFTRPHGPWQNGKAERTDRTLTPEWAYAWPYETNAERAARPFSASWTTTIATGRTAPAEAFPPMSRVHDVLANNSWPADVQSSPHTTLPSERATEHVPGSV